MKCLLMLVVMLSASVGSALAQCAAGIPSAGNPGCIPPTAPSSPYNLGTDPYPGAGADSAATPVWRETWGAIALDMTVGRAGMSDTEDSKDAAVAVALARCKNAGGTRCEIRVTYHNQCVALAQERGGGEVATATGPSKRRVEARSVDACGGESKCAVVYSACSDSVRVR